MQHSEILTQATARLLRPLVRILLRYGIAYDAFCELIKNLYVDIAESEFLIPGKKQTISRISTLTGLSRKEVSKAMEHPELNLSSLTQQYNRAARVITGWVHDEDYLTENGSPAELTLEGDAISFESLVKRYSGDIPPRAIADELMRVGAIRQVNGKVKLSQRAYLPQQDIDEKLRILGTDVSDLIATIDHNIHMNEGEPYFQRKVAYNAVLRDKLPQLRAILADGAQSCLEELDQHILKCDSDANPKLKERGDCRIGVGIYYFEGDDQQ